MNFDIASNKCEICNEKARVGMNDTKDQLHYSCEKHVTDLWDKLGKP